MIQVTRKDSKESVENLLRRFNRKVLQAGELYDKNGAKNRAESELAEKELIETYLPEQASEEDVKKAVDEEMAAAGELSLADMGRIIGAVRGRLGGSADGALIAKLVKK